MILTGQLEYLMKGLWTIAEKSTSHIVCRNNIDDAKYIEVKKNPVVEKEPYCVVAVSIPLEHGRYLKRFPSEMLAYEYIEDFVMEPTDRLDTTVDVFRITCPDGYDIKRRRLSM